MYSINLNPPSARPSNRSVGVLVIYTDICTKIDQYSTFFQYAYTGTSTCYISFPLMVIYRPMLIIERQTILYMRC